MAPTAKASPTQILEALATSPETTAADLALKLGLGQSTMAKYLVALEGEGRVTRIAGGRDGGKRIADRWSVTVERPTRRRARVAALASEEANEPRVSDEAVVQAAPPRAPRGVSESRSRDGEASERLEPGGLRALVLEFVTARPGAAFGPSAIGTALNRSRGAVANALVSLEARREVELVGESPRRYQLAAR